MEVAFVEAVGIDLHALLHVGLHLQTGVDDERSSGLDERGVVAEALEIGFLGAVDVQMVGVGGCDDAHPGTQPVETAVKLVSLNHDVVALAEDVVGAIVLGDSSEEGVAVYVALVHDVGTHGGCGGLAVGSGKAQALVGAGECTEHLGALLDGEAALTEKDHLLVLGRDGGSIDDQTGGCVATWLGY